MDVKVRVKGIEEILRGFNKQVTDIVPTGKPRPAVAVGYKAKYSLIVHESRIQRHKKGRGAGYLLDPMKLMARDINRGAQANLKRGKTLSEALMIEGRKLLRASQRVVPVKTGYLKASGYVKDEG